MAETSVLSRVLQAIQDRNHASVRGILATVSIEEIEAEVGKVRSLVLRWTPSKYHITHGL